MSRAVGGTMGEHEHTRSWLRCAACHGLPCAFYVNALRTAQQDGASDFPAPDLAKPVRVGEVRPHVDRREILDALTGKEV